MTLRQLRIFRKICEEGSVTRAADALYLTQPAVSHALGQLEEELGTALFDRSGRSLLLTPQGGLLLEKAIRVLELYDNLEQSARGLERQAGLRVGSSITIANFWLPAMVKRYQAQCDTPLQVEIDRASAVTEKLLRLELDVALIEGPIAQEELLAVPFSSYRLVAVCAPGHPFANQETRTLEELSGETLLLRERGSAIRDALDSAMTLHGLSVRPAWTSVNSQALIRASGQGLGVSVLPDILAEEAVQAGTLRTVTLDCPELLTTNSIVCHRDRYQTGPMKAFLQAALMSEN